MTAALSALAARAGWQAGSSSLTPSRRPGPPGSTNLNGWVAIAWAGWRHPGRAAGWWQQQGCSGDTVGWYYFGPQSQSDSESRRVGVGGPTTEGHWFWIAPAAHVTIIESERCCVASHAEAEYSGFV